jgi:aminoglycoside 6-adenylyltransferase
VFCQNFTMRSPEEIKKLILGFAGNDERIRAVLLSGSRANPEVNSDKLQDFDIVFIVRDLISFTTDHSWADFPGDKIITQLPDEMTFGQDIVRSTPDFHYLMLLKDGNRVDLTLFPLDKLKNFKPDSLTIVWIDKDTMFSDIPSPQDSDYHVRKPSEKEFSDTCNEFWWVSTYVAKGLFRGEISYAKAMNETVLRPMFMKAIEWKIGAGHDFRVSFGKAGRFMKLYLPGDLYERILMTYSGSDVEENWKSLLIMTDIFSQFTAEVADKLNFPLNRSEEQNVTEYLKRIHEGNLE